jgi:hypothetical protein
MHNFSTTLKKHQSFVFYACTGIVYLLLLLSASRQWFFYDEWDLLGPRYEVFLNGDWLEFLFSPLVDHLTAINVVIYTLVIELFGIDSYFPIGFLMVTSHLGVSLIMRAILRSKGLSNNFSNFAFFFILLFGPGIEDILWGVQIGYNVAIILSLGQYLLLKKNDYKFSLMALILGITSILGQSIAVVFLISLFLFLVIQKKFSLALVQSGIPLLLYAIWNFTFGLKASTPGFSLNPRLLSNYIKTFLSELSNAIFQIPGFSFFSFILILAALAILMTNFRSGYDLVYFGSAFIIYVLSVSITRAGLGAEQAASSRYMYVGAIFMVFIFSEIIPHIPQINSLLFRRFLALLGVYMVLSNSIVLYSSSRDRELFNQETKRIVTEFVLRDDFQIQPDDLQVDPSRNPQIKAGNLKTLYDAAP